MTEYSKKTKRDFDINDVDLGLGDSFGIVKPNTDKPVEGASIQEDPPLRKLVLKKLDESQEDASEIPDFQEKSELLDTSKAFSIKEDASSTFLPTNKVDEPDSNFTASFRDEMQNGDNSNIFKNIAPTLNSNPSAMPSFESVEKKLQSRDISQEKIETVKESEKVVEVEVVDSNDQVIEEASIFVSPKEIVSENNLQSERSRLKFLDSLTSNENKTSRETIQKTTALGKITPIKIPANEAIISHSDSEIGLDSPLKNQEDVERIDKILSSISSLLMPFKDILLKTLPFLRIPLGIIEAGFTKIASFIRWFSRRIPIFIALIKSKYFKIIVVLAIFLFLVGTIITRVVNFPENIKALENAIYDNTGYKVAINGLIKVRILPTPAIAIKSVTFYLNSLPNDDFKISQLAADYLTVNFKFIPLLWGSIQVDKVSINQSVIDVLLKKNSAPSTDISAYVDMIKNIDKSTAFKINQSASTPVIKKVDSNKNNDILKQLDEVISSDKPTVDDEIVENIDLQKDSILEDVIKQEEAVEKTPLSNENSIKLVEPIDNQGEKSGSGDNKGLKGKDELTPPDSAEEEILRTKPIINLDDSPVALPENQEDLPESDPSNLEDRDALGYPEDVATESVKLSNKSGAGFTYGLFSKIINKISFSLKGVDSISIVRGKINIISDDNKIITSIDNITGKLQTNFFKGINSEGSFRFMGNNAVYKSDFEYSDDKINFVLKMSFSETLQEGIILEGVKTKDGVQAKISSMGNGELVFIDKFLFPINVKDVEKHDFKANLVVNSGRLEINEINFQIEDMHYMGNFIWDLSKNNHNILLDLDVKIPDITSHLQEYAKYIENNSSNKSSSFLSLVEVVNLWKSRQINNFKARYFKVNLRVKDSILNETPLDDLQLSFLFDDRQKLYLEKLNILSNNVNLNVFGKFDIDNKNAMLSIASKGSIASFYKLAGLSDRNLSFIRQIGKEKDQYDLKTKVIISQNKFVFNDIVGSLGDRKIENTYALYLERSVGSDLLVNTKLLNLDFSDLANIYNAQTVGLSEESENKISVFGIPENLKVSLTLQADNFNYKGIKFKDVAFDTNLMTSGFRIKKFEGKGIHGGSIIASFIADDKVIPMVAGHFNLENFVLKLEDTKNLIFKGKNVIGDVYLNGKMKFTGDVFENPFAKLEGELTFVKYERVKLNRFANVDGLYITLSEKTQGKNTNYLVNDVYGRIKIKDSKVDFYPVVMLYIYNNREYRGTFDGSFNFLNNDLKLKGTVDNADNVNNQMDFSIEGSLFSPKYFRKFSRSKNSNVAVKQTQKKTTLNLNDKDYKLANKLNNINDKDNFNNTYNKNIPEEERYLLDNLYEDTLDVSLFDGKEEGEDFKSTYPIKEAESSDKQDENKD